MEDKYCFVAVEFPEDINVAGNLYWYLCPIKGVKAGDGVIAPLGRHNRLQKGVVRKVIFEKPSSAPYPFNLIKSVVEVSI